MTRSERDHARRRNSTHGQAMVEFALIFPVIVLIILGIFDLGRGVYAFNTVANAARLGARIATVNQIATSPLGDCDETRPVEAVLTAHWSVKTCAALSATSLGIQESAVSVTFSPPPGTTLTCSPVRVGCIATVTVRYAFAPITPVIGNIVGPIAMSSTSEEPVERVFP